MRRTMIKDIKRPKLTHILSGKGNGVNCFSKIQKYEISKELETINFKVLQQNHLDNGAKEGSAKYWISNDTNSGDDGKNKIKDQFTSYQKAMKMVIIWGQCIGINPLTGILQKDVSKMRFTKCSFQYVFAMIIAGAQFMATILAIYRLYKYPNVGFLGSVAFLSPACLTTISFIRIAPKWPPLMKEVINSRLDEYIHPRVVRRCKIASAVYIGMCLVDHAMSIGSNIVHILECREGKVVNVLDEYLRGMSSWLFELNVPFEVWLGMFLEYLNLVNTAAWNYLDIFIVCISLYLTSIMEQINKKIHLTASKNYVPASTWGVLRKDYNRATNLIKIFDDMFSGLVVIAFANDLFAICLQLYNVLAKVIRSPQLIDKICPGNDNSIFRLVFPAYVTYSTAFLIVRFITMALVASGVHSSSLVSLPVLYAVPATSFCKEVERFQNQVNTDTVAISGLHFFYITRNLVLTVTGTIVTYELVLLQLKTDD
ncbi:hypothetical protein PYW07_014333 [Mythimna separata]|uniref:Gustatory receptor n=1 Tax=Mythimna separata TaxID=271217 RepID=A0AAD7Z133_MYTSE|nr:hypothetical protein PYW07_014333 [Mythimna separata]